MRDEPTRRFRSRGLGSGPPYEPPTADEIEARIRDNR
jgi:hypothetical protein